MSAVESRRFFSLPVHHRRGRLRLLCATGRAHRELWAKRAREGLLSADEVLALLAGYVGKKHAWNGTKAGYRRDMRPIAAARLAACASDSARPQRPLRDSGLRLVRSDGGRRGSPAAHRLPRPGCLGRPLRLGVLEPPGGGRLRHGRPRRAHPLHRDVQLRLALRPQPAGRPLSSSLRRTPTA